MRTILLHQARVLLEFQLSVSQGAEVVDTGVPLTYGPSKHLLCVALSTGEAHATAEALCEPMLRGV